MKAYIFDLDGTLLDSTGLWGQIDIDFLAKRGFDVPSNYEEAICALSFPEAAEYTIQRFGLPDTVEELVAEWKDMAAYAYGNEVSLKPNARAYLESLKGRGAKLGIATGLPIALCNAVLQNNGILDLFDITCSVDEVGCGKNEPDVFQLAVQKLGVEPAECIVFEDIPQAIKSAKDAGMCVYGVYDKGSAENWALIQEIADGVIYDFKEAPLPE